ncbi:MAG: hypothetical protein OEZ23_08220, partial [Gammaproteobacteria bacterium]|nr:hypothetical protein [Gammaproteobacteria bacterium]
MAKQFDVVISPGVTKKSSPKDVAALLARQLKIDHAKAYKWVTGKNPVTIVKATSQETASQYVKAITATGALAKAVVHKPGANAKVAGAAKAASGGGRSPLGHPLIVAILSGLVSLAGGWFGLQYWQEMELERIRMTPPTSEAREAAEITAAAFGLYMTGNGDMATELADLLQRMRGKNTEQLQSEQNIVIDMMKGLGVDEFIRMVSGADIQGRQGRSDTMQGVSSFTRSELELIGPSLLTHGYESLLHRVALRQEIPDLKNPGRMLQISTLDKVTDDELKPSLAIFNIDQEWDLYMLSLTDAFLKNERPGEAKSLAEKIMNPVIRAQALGKIVVYFQFRRQPEKLVAEYLRLIENTLINLPDPASAITVRIDIARQLADAGDQAEPARTYNQVRKAVAEEKNVY